MHVCTVPCAAGDAALIKNKFLNASISTHLGQASTEYNASLNGHVAHSIARDAEDFFFLAMRADGHNIRACSGYVYISYAVDLVVSTTLKTGGADVPVSKPVSCLCQKCVKARDARG